MKKIYFLFVFCSFSFFLYSSIDLDPRWFVERDLLINIIRGTLDDEKRLCQEGVSRACYSVAKRILDRARYEEIDALDDKRDFCRDGDTINCHSAVSRVRDARRAQERAPSEALVYFAQACEQSELGCSEAGAMYVTKNNLQKAKELFKVSCNRGNKASCVQYAVLDEEINPKKSFEVFVTECKDGNGFGCYSAGSFLQKRNASSDALGFFEKGCKENDPYACFSMATWNVDRENYYTAFEYSKKACSHSLDDQICSLTIKLHEGLSRLGLVSNIHPSPTYHFKKYCEENDEFGSCVFYKFLSFF